METQAFRSLALSLCALAASAASASAQIVPWTPVVGPPIQVTQPQQPGFEWYFEPSINVSTTNPDEFMVGVMDMGPGTGEFAAIAYFISTDGGQTISPQRFFAPAIPCGNTPNGWNDPWVAAAPDTGDLWLACMDNFQKVVIAHKPPGATDLDPDSVRMVVCGPSSANGRVDHPSVAVRPLLDSGEPGPLSPQRRLDIVYFGEGCPSPNWQTQWLSTSLDGGDTWQAPSRVAPPGDDCAFAGRSVPVMVALENGDLIVATAEVEPGTGAPWVFRYDAQLGEWVSPHIDLGAVFGTLPPSVDELGIAGIDIGRNFPTLAVDPTNPEHVYVLWTVASPHGDQNVDLLIARSVNGGVSFEDDPADFMHLTDELVHNVNGDSNGPDQVLAGMAIDGCGGINLVFYSEHDALAGWYHVYYVRITNFGPNPNIYRKRLTANPTFEFFYGHYIQMAASGPRAWPVYIAAQDGDTHVFTHRIITCIGDVNMNNAVEPADAQAFNSAFATGDRAADVNQDGCVDTSDFLLFQDSYAAGCGN